MAVSAVLGARITLKQNPNWGVGAARAGTRGSARRRRAAGAWTPCCVTRRGSCGASSTALTTGQCLRLLPSTMCIRVWVRNAGGCVLESKSDGLRASHSHAAWHSTSRRLPREPQQIG